MRTVLIASYDMEVGGVERCLAGMLDQFDYARYKVDLMLYRHQGDFMGLLSNQAHLLNEVPQYASFRKSIVETLKEKQLGIGLTRILSKAHADLNGRFTGISEPGYIQQQLMWKYALPFLPRADREYDVAISYLWPHYFVADKVKASKKIAWIHTDYSTITTNRELDLKMWQQFDRIVAVSEACKASFLQQYDSLSEKVIVMENIISPESIRTMAKDEAAAQMMLGDSRFKLLTVGRLSHAKGIDNAVRAFKLLVDKGYDDLVWYVVGYGGDEALIRQLIADYRLDDRFILLGKQTNPYPFMKACDLYVQPSRYEGKAVTVTEAKILGKPVMITNYSTAASQVMHKFDGYIAQLSVEGIASGIEKLYQNGELRQRLANNCAHLDFGNSNELEKLYEWMDHDGREQDGH